MVGRILIREVYEITICISISCVQFIITVYACNGINVWVNRTTCLPISVLRYVLDKDLTSVWKSVFTPSYLVLPNKSWRRVKQFIFCCVGVVVKDVSMLVHHSLLLKYEILEKMVTCMHHVSSAEWVDRIYSSVKYTDPTESDIV